MNATETAAERIPEPVLTGFANGASLAFVNAMGLIQTFVQAAAGVGRGFVSEFGGVQQAVFSALCVVRFLARRPVAGRRQVVVACWAQALAFGLLIRYPGAVTLGAVVVCGALTSTTLATLRIALRTRAQAAGLRLQARDQLASYVTVTAVSAALVGLAIIGGWRWAVGLLMVVAIVAGFVCWQSESISNGVPDATREPVSRLLELVQAPAMRRSIVAGAVLNGMFTFLVAVSQIRFGDLHWSSGWAAGLSYSLAMGRVLSLPIAGWVRRALRRVRTRRMAFGLALAAGPILAGGVLDLVTVGVSDRVTATVLMVGGSFAFEAGMNAATPMLRWYVNQSSNGATLSTILATALSAIAGGLAPRVPWPAATVVMIVGGATAIWFGIRAALHAEVRGERIPAAQRLTLRIDRAADLGAGATHRISLLDGRKVLFVRSIGPGGRLELRPAPADRDVWRVSPPWAMVRWLDPAEPTPATTVRGRVGRELCDSSGRPVARLAHDRELAVAAPGAARWWRRRGEHPTTYGIRHRDADRLPPFEVVIRQGAM